MALSDIIRRIESDARDEAEQIVGTAEKDAERIRADVRTQVQTQRGDTLMRTQAVAEEEARTRFATAKLRGRDSILGEKRELMSRVLARAVASIESLDGDAYAALLARHVAVLARGGESVAVAASDASRLAGLLEPALKAAGADVTVSGWDAPIERGVLLEGPRMHVEISPSALVEGERERLEELVAGVLFDWDAGTMTEDGGGQ